jgi:hypothetical protein
MDRPPPKLPNTASRLIAMAANLAGSSDEVRALMDCSQTEFDTYRSGAKEPSWSQLYPVVDLIVREQAKVVKRNRDAIETVRKLRK